MIKVCVLLAFAVLLLFPLRSVARDAAVTIVITDRSGARAFGSGFVLSPSGHVITCYHVVEGAVAITVFYKKLPYDAQVIEIAPDRDVAELQMNGVSLPIDYFPVRYDLPSNLTMTALTVEGFAAGLFDQQVPAHATQDKFALSDQMSGINNERLFAIKGIRILPLAVTIYKGMSGAPVLTKDGQVLGIVSGSLSQGGSIAWAIAIENSRPEFATKLNGSMATFSWPPLGLMVSNWGNLRSETGIGKDLLEKVEAASQAVAAVQRTLVVECGDDNVVVQGLTSLLATYDRYAKIANMPVSVFQQPGDGQSLLLAASPQVNALDAQMTTASKDLDIAITAVQDASARADALKRTAEDYEQNLPTTDKNSRIVLQLFSQSSVRDAKHADIQNAMEQARRQRVVVPSKRDLVSDYRNVYQAQLVNWTGYQSLYCSSLPQLYSLINASAVDYRLLLNADIIAPGN